MAYSMRAENIRYAEAAIDNGDLHIATALYEKLVRRLPVDEFIYGRLMMLYRKQKEYAKELQLIATAIQAITSDFYGKGLSSFKDKPAVKRISNALVKSLGMRDAKGHYLYEPKIVTKWKRRKVIAAHKLAKLKRA